MNKARVFRVNGTKYLLEVRGGLCTIWDTEIESASLDWGSCEEMPNGVFPPSPVVAEGLTEEEAFDWLMEALGLDRAFIPMTRV